jgi:integrase
VTVSDDNQALDRAPVRRAGLLGKLMAAVRPQFRAEVIVCGPGDPVLGVSACAVPGCDYPVADHGICNGHRLRWRSRGQPELAEFLTDAGPPLRGRAELSCCTVTGCRYGAAGHGLCYRHRTAWERAGRPDAITWAAGVSIVDTGGRIVCRLPFCHLWAETSTALFCKSHSTRWQRSGHADPEEFIGDCTRLGKALFDFRRLPPQLRLELQYAVQCRSDAGTVAAPPTAVMPAIGWASQAGVSSLLDLSERQWQVLARARRGAAGGGGKYGRAQAFLLFARDVVETLADGAGWEAEYSRDVWRLSRLPGLVFTAGQTREHARLRFDRITPPWLRSLAKRWIRLRLAAGLNVETVVGNVQALTRFSQFLTTTAPHIVGLPAIDRPLLERYLAWLATTAGGPSTKSRHIGGVHLFLQAIRQHGWDDTLPTTATFFASDHPPRPPRLTRRLAEHVMAQIEHPANLDRWPTRDARLITLILIRCGLRISDACTLPFDCLVHDGQGAPYLRYLNNKMKREAAVPIDDELEGDIRAQQHHVADRWPHDIPNLFPRTKANANGQRPFSPSSYRPMLKRWLQTCHVRDEHGRPVHLTPHQWRHTFACRLINRDVPQEVIRVLLDHESSQMTAHYARITDQTVRRRWEQATKVNIKGERVSIDPNGPLAQAQWAKTRYGIATQSLPNGYCGLPVQKSCPHANACLTCPVFVTGPEFLPELRQQHHRTLTLIHTAQANGQARVAEMNKQVLTNLHRMISEIERDEQAGAADAG